MEIYDFLVGLFCALICYQLFGKYRLFRKMAPGPYGLPVVGSMIHLVKKNAIEEFQNYKKIYGKIFSLAVGDFYVTVITDHKLIIENLKKDEFQGRPNFGIWKVRNQGDRNRGVLLSDGPVWHEQRRFVLRTLRDFGFGKENMEGMLQQELHDLRNVLRNDLGHPVNLSGVFNASVLNSLWFIVTGKRFELSDPSLNTLIALLIEFVKDSLLTSPALFFYNPVKYGLVGRKQFQKGVEFRARVKELLDEVIDEHLETYLDGECRDFVDSYIRQMKDSSSDSSFYGDEGRKNLYSVLLDLFIAGAETTSTTLQWASLFLSHYPHVQRKAQAEIDNLIGKSRPPNRSDRTKLVYLEAVLNEVHRLSSLVPFSVFHRAFQDSYIGGHLIPKDSVIFFSIYDAHHDPEVWGDPDVFRPERFLDPTETKVVRNEALIPFSSGKRQCLGETLARDTLFVFLAGLLQAFSLEIDPECSNSELKGTPSFVSSPQPFKIIIHER